MIEIRELGQSDLNLLLAVPDGLFDQPIDPAQAAAFLADNGHVIVLAFDGDLAVGMATGTILLHPDKKPSMFVNEVGTRDGWLRQGIATALMQRMFIIARTRGCEDSWLGTETDNERALALYRKLGGDEQVFVGFGWDGAFDVG